MLRLLLGLVSGFALGAYFSRRMEDGELRDRITEMQARLTSLMNESTAVIQDTRGELKRAWEEGRRSAEQKAERLRTAAVSGESITGNEGRAQREETPQGSAGTDIEGEPAPGGSMPGGEGASAYRQSEPS